MKNLLIKKITLIYKLRFATIILLFKDTLNKKIIFINISCGFGIAIGFIFSLTLFEVGGY